MTYQEVFDTVLTALFKQGRASHQPGAPASCQYLQPIPGAAPLRCAAGWLFEEEEYTPAFEGMTARQLTMHFPLEALPAIMRQAHEDYWLMQLITKLQEAHDKHLALAGMENWLACMQCIANEFDLTFTDPRGAL